MPTDNETIVQRWWEELWNGNKLALVDELIAPDYTNHDPASPWVPGGTEGARTLMSAYHTVFPDIHFAIEGQVAAADTVVSHWRCTGTHRGELMGIAPTGKPVSIEGISIFHLRGGKIRHQTTIWDALGMLQQLGAASVPVTSAG